MYTAGINHLGKALKQLLILNLLKKILQTKKGVTILTTSLLFFNPTQHGLPHNIALQQTRQIRIDRIDQKKIKLDTAYLVRLESCVKIPEYIPDSHLRVLYKNSKKYSIPIKIITKLISVESDWVKDTSSRCGAYGYGQIMPSTKRYIAKKLGERVRKDPKQDIKYTIIYLREMLDDAHGDMRLALAYYNGGPNVLLHMPRETRRYTNAIMKCSK